MRRAPSEQCDYVFEGSAADCYAVFRKNNKVKKSNITGCSAVGSAPALGEYDQPNKITKYPGVAQLVARLLWEQDAAGSNPVTRTTFPRKTASLGGFSAL